METPFLRCFHKPDQEDILWVWWRGWNCKCGHSPDRCEICKPDQMAGRESHQCPSFRWKPCRRLCSIQDPGDRIRWGNQAFSWRWFPAVHDRASFRKQCTDRRSSGWGNGRGRRQHEADKSAEYHRFYELCRKNPSGQYPSVGKKKPCCCKITWSVTGRKKTCAESSFNHDEYSVEEQLFWIYWSGWGKKNPGWRTLWNGTC